MDDFVAYPSRPKIALLTLGCVTFVAGGLWMAGVFGPPPPSRRYSPELVFAIGWSTTVFFGLCGVMGVVRLFNGREELRIGPAGIRAARWSNQTIPWSEILDVSTWSYKNQKSIILHLRDRSRFPGRGVAALLAGANRSLTGGDIAISLTGTNRSVEEALTSIDRFRSHIS